MGIGTTSPAYHLDVNANNGRIRVNGTTGYVATDYENSAGSFYVGRESSTGGSFVSGSSAYAGILAVQGAYPLQFTTNNSVRATFTSAGNVGIGTTNPLQKFVVYSGSDMNFCVDGNTGYSSIYSLTDAGASNGFRVAGYPLMFTGNGAGGDEAMRVIANGNVGIGTTAPGHILTVAGQGSDNTAVFALDITGTGSGLYNWASSAIAPNLPATYNLIHMIGQAESDYNSGYIGFNFQENGSMANFLTFGLFNKNNIMNITGAGYVGIGTTTPRAK